MSEGRFLWYILWIVNSRSVFRFTLSLSFQLKPAIHLVGNGPVPFLNILLKIARNGTGPFPTNSFGIAVESSLFCTINISYPVVYVYHIFRRNWSDRWLRNRKCPRREAVGGAFVGVFRIESRSNQGIVPWFSWEIDRYYSPKTTLFWKYSKTTLDCRKATLKGR